MTAFHFQHTDANVGKVLIENDRHLPDVLLVYTGRGPRLGPGVEVPREVVAVLSGKLHEWLTGVPDDRPPAWWLGAEPVAATVEEAKAFPPAWSIEIRSECGQAVESVRVEGPGDAPARVGMIAQNLVTEMRREPDQAAADLTLDLLAQAFNCEPREIVEQVERLVRSLDAERSKVGLLQGQLDRVNAEFSTARTEGLAQLNRVIASHEQTKGAYQGAEQELQRAHDRHEETKTALQEERDAHEVTRDSLRDALAKRHELEVQLQQIEDRTAIGLGLLAQEIDGLQGRGGDTSAVGVFNFLTSVRTALQPPAQS
jgi:hypothetical protein